MYVVIVEYIDAFKEHRIKIASAIKSVIEILLYCYFYSQGFQFRRPDDFYRKNLAIAGKYLRLCKQTFNLTNQSIYNVIASENGSMYYQIYELAAPGAGHFIPTQSLKQWIDLVDSCYLE